MTAPDALIEQETIHLSQLQRDQYDSNKRQINCPNCDVEITGKGGIEQCEKCGDCIGLCCCCSKPMQRGNHNALQFGLYAVQEARLKLAIIKADTDRIERMTR